MSRNMAIVSDLCAHRIASRPRAVTVTGTDVGSGFYKDDEGGMWKYETKAGFPFGQVRGSTDQYGGITTAWYDRGAFDDHPDALNAKMDTMASTWVDTSVDSPTSGDTGAEGDSTPADATPSDTTPSSGKPKPKAGMTAKPAPKAGGGAPVAKAASGSSSLLIAGLIAIPLAVGAIWMWMRSSAAASSSARAPTPAPTPPAPAALAPAPSSAASPPLLSATSSVGGVL